MAQIANLVLADGQSTPVNHTFTPVGVSGGIARYQDVSSGFAVSFPTITTSLRLPTKALPSSKAVMKIVLPVTEVLAPSSIPTKVFELIANIEVVMPEKATLAQRKDIAAYTKNLLASTPVQAILIDLISTW